MGWSYESIIVLTVGYVLTRCKDDIENVTFLGQENWKLINLFIADLVRLNFKV